MEGWGWCVFSIMVVFGITVWKCRFKKSYKIVAFLNQGFKRVFSRTHAKPRCVLINQTLLKLWLVENTVSTAPRHTTKWALNTSFLVMQGNGIERKGMEIKKKEVRVTITKIALMGKKKLVFNLSKDYVSFWIILTPLNTSYS